MKNKMAYLDFNLVKKIIKYGELSLYAANDLEMLIEDYFDSNFDMICEHHSP